jgi:hypothetical protein
LQECCHVCRSKDLLAFPLTTYGARQNNLSESFWVAARTQSYTVVPAQLKAKWNQLSIRKGGGGSEKPQLDHPVLAKQPRRLDWDLLLSLLMKCVAGFPYSPSTGRCRLYKCAARPSCEEQFLALMFLLVLAVHGHVLETYNTLPHIA